MNIMDEKGRLFGRINVIDFVVILLLFSLIPILYVGYKLNTREDHAVMRSVSIKVRSVETMPELINVIKPGDVDMDPSGKPVGKIARIFEAVPSEVVVLRGDNQLTMKTSNIKKDVLIMIEAVCEVKGGLLYYKEQPVKIGENIIFSTNLYTLRGVITDIETK